MAGNAQLSGTLTQSSDQRLKTNIQSLNASSSLSLIDALNPATFNWIDSNQGTGPQVGFRPTEAAYGRLKNENGKLYTSGLRNTDHAQPTNLAGRDICLQT
jgi:hypothetical protein